eukprot:Ihof_evm9s168 gene=Ihof_evmTU9s168
MDDSVQVKVEPGTQWRVLLKGLFKLAQPPTITDTLKPQQQQESCEAILRNEDVVGALAVAGSFALLDIPMLNISCLDVNPTGPDVQWQWVQYLLHIINALHQEVGMSDSKEEHSTMSFQEMFHFKLALQVVSVWGITPSLPIGIGHPLAKRLADSNKDKSPVLNSLRPPHLHEEAAKDQRLMCIARWILPSAVGNNEISNILQTDILVDLASGLCQLARPLTRPGSVPGASIPTSSLTAEQRKAASQAVTCLTRNARVDLAMEALSLSSQSRKAPDWLRRFTTFHLSSCLMREGGVEALVVQTLGSATNEDTERDSTAKAALVICSWPQQVAPADVYYAAIADQVVHLMHVRASVLKDLGKRLQRAATEIALRLLETPRAEARQQLLTRVFTPLRIIVQGEGVVEEHDLHMGVEDLHRLFVAGRRGDLPDIALLAPVIPALFQLYCYTRRTPANLKVACNEVLEVFFKNIDATVGVNMLLDLVLPSSINTSLDLRVEFSPSPTGGVQVKTIGSAQRDFSWECESVIELLGGLKRTSLAGDYFVRLVDEFMVLAEQGVIDKAPPKSENFLDGGEALDKEKATAQRYMYVLQSVMMLVEKLKVSILHNARHVISFAKMLANSPEMDTVAMALGLLTTLLSGAVTIKKEDEGLISELHGWLEPYTHHPEEELREIAIDLRTSIRTRDPLWLQVRPPTAPEDTAANEVLPDHPLVEEESKITSHEDSLATALEQLRDIMLPVRAHGLITMRRLIRQRDPSTIDNVDRLLEVFEGQLHHPDSYIYLAAIGGLATLGAIYPRTTVHVIAKQFANRDLSEDDRLKYGEVISKLVEECQPTILKPYLTDLVPALLLAASPDTSRDPVPGVKGVIPRVGQSKLEKNSPFVVASSLSSLAKICEIMGPTMQLFLEGVVDVVTSNMDKYMDDTQKAMVTEIGQPARKPQPSQSKREGEEEEPLDERMEVRRGAMHLMALMFTGLGPQSL